MFIKPQNIAFLMNDSNFSNKIDLGFTGSDWMNEAIIQNNHSLCTEVLDTRLDPVSIIVAKQKNRSLCNVVASEYPNLTKQWIGRNNLSCTYLHSFGTTESLIPQFADYIIENSATGETLRDNDFGNTRNLNGFKYTCLCYPPRL